MANTMDKFRELATLLRDADKELAIFEDDAVCDHSVGICWCSYQRVRERLKAAAAQMETALTQDAADQTTQGESAPRVVAWARPLYATEPAEGWEPGDVVDIEFHNRAEKPEGEGWRPLVFADTGDGTAPLPRINIKCETVDNGITGVAFLKVIRVEQEDDGSLTAVTDHWPRLDDDGARVTDEDARVAENAARRGRVAREGGAK